MTRRSFFSLNRLPCGTKLTTLVKFCMRWRTAATSRARSPCAAAGMPRPERHQARLDAQREHVDALDDDHVVRASQYLEAERRASAGAGLGEDLHQIVRAHALERACLAPDGGINDLALLAVLEGQH